MSHDSMYVWHTDPETKKVKYRGEFMDIDLALAWVKNQPNSDEFEVTNQGPSALVRERKKGNPWDVQTPEGERKQRHYESVAPYLDKPTTNERGDRKALKPPKSRSLIPQWTGGATGSRPIHKPAAKVVPKRALTADELAIQAAAKIELQGHRAAEKRDIDNDAEFQAELKK